LLLIFAAVIGVIYLLYKLLRKAGAPKIGETRLLKVLSSQSLGGNRSLHLVEVGNAVYLVGAGESAVSLVAEITEKETLDNIRLQASVETGVGGRRSFADLMGGMFGRGGGKTASTGLHPLSTEFLKKQRERLKKMR
jgi:flagellar protein FliO/FliZ